MKLKILFVLLLLIFSCKKESDVVVEVNGRKIYIYEFPLYRMKGEPDRDAIEEVIVKELFARQAEKMNLDEEPDVKGEISAYRRLVLAKKFEEKILEKEMKEENIRKFYEDNRALFTKKKILLSHILIRIPSNATPNQLAVAHSKAISIMNELKKGGDFSELARKYSDDRLTAQKGGVMGYVDVESLPKGIKDAVSEMKEGEVKGPIMTEFGYHIIKAGSPVTDEILPYEAVRNTAIAYLRAKVIAEMRDRLRKKAKIKLIKR